MTVEWALFSRASEACISSCTTVIDGQAHAPIVTPKARRL
jgi:hypothetical protein